MAYALASHEKHNSLQIARQVAKEKYILQLILLEQACDVTQHAAKALNDKLLDLDLQMCLLEVLGKYKLHKLNH